MASYTKVFSSDIGDSYRISSGKTVSISATSGSVGKTIKSASVTVGLSCTSGAGSTTFSISVSVGGASGSANVIIPSGSATGYQTTISLSGISGVEWTSSSLDLTVRCTAASGGHGSVSTIYIKGEQKITVLSSTTESGGGDSGEGSGSNEGSAVSASSISLNKTSATVGTTVTCNIYPNSSSAYHRVTWSINGSTVSGPTTINAGTTTASLSIASSHMKYIPNNITGTLTCNVQTYSSSGLLAGYSAASCTVTVPTSYVPSFTFTGSNFTPADKRNNKCYINISRPGVNITGISPGSGSSLSKYTISCTGMNSVSNNFALSATSMSYVYDTKFSTSGTATISVTVVDTRGRSTTKSYSFNIEAYSPPTVESYDTYRCDEEGNGTSNGQYLRIVLDNISVGNISDTFMKISTITVKTKTVSEENYTTVRTINVDTNIISQDMVLPGYSVDTNYDIQIEVKDTFDTVTSLYDRIFKYGGVLFDICGVPNNNSIGIGEGVTGKGIESGNVLTLYDRKLVINGAWDIIYKGGDISNYFLKMSDVVGGTSDTNNTKVRMIYYGNNQPSNPVAGTLWIKPNSL